MFTHKKVDIRVDGAGRFLANIADAELFADTLAAIKAKIDAELSATPKRTINLPVVGVVTKPGRDVSDKQTVGRATITGVNRTTRELQLDGLPKGCEMGYMLPDTPANVAIVERWLEVLAEHGRLYGMFKDRRIKPTGYGRIDITEYDAIVDEVLANYAKAANGAKG
jgi:hypothetical protein